MNIVIIEDEELSARRLESMILAFDPGVNVLARLESIEEAVKWFSSNQSPDLIFLDIHLEDGLSFVIFEKVQVNAPIIFTTAYDEYAIKAFKLKSIDYLLKPITQENLNQAIRKYRDWTGSRPQTIDVSSLYEMLSLRTPSYKTRFSISTGLKIRSVDISDVAYFYSVEGITFLVTRDKMEYAIDLSLDKLAGELDPKQFFRINRQYIVSLRSIGQVHIFPKSHLKVDLLPQVKGDVFVSIDRVPEFKRWLDGE